MLEKSKRTSYSILTSSGVVNTGYFSSLGNLSIPATISKLGGDSSNTENSEFYGVNAGILVTENSTATIKNAQITTNAKGSNAVFSTGTNSKIYVSDTTINTTVSGSARGLDATYGGYIEADNVTIKTLGGSSATLATDRGEGTVIAKNQELTGNIEADSISTIVMNLSNSNYTGTINGENTAKSITLKLDSSSEITLTGDSYITALETSDTSYSNINFNGYKLYVNGVAIN